MLGARRPREPVLVHRHLPWDWVGRTTQLGVSFLDGDVRGWLRAEAEGAHAQGGSGVCVPRGHL